MGETTTWTGSQSRLARSRHLSPICYCYIAGGDRTAKTVGGLAGTLEGKEKQRENWYPGGSRTEHPVMVTCAGRYAKHVEDTVTIHCKRVAGGERGVRLKRTATRIGSSLLK